MMISGWDFLKEVSHKNFCSKKRSFHYPIESCDDPMPIYVVENDYSDEEPSSAESDDAETIQERKKYI